MSQPGVFSERPFADSPAGANVTDIEWEPVEPGEDGSGEVTIEHTATEDVSMPMTLDGARRLADRLFGDDKIERPLTGHGIHWARKGRPQA
jgi:hypothetical protein